MSTNIETRKRLLAKIDELANQPITYEMLKNVYLAAKEMAYNDALWYQMRQRKWRGGTRGLKIVTYLALGVGVLLPLWSGKHPSLLNCGYGSLVIAGLLFSADQIFIFSKTWVRYIDAEMKIRELLLAFQFEWYADRVAFGESVADDVAKNELGKIKDFVVNVQAVVTAETQKWEQEIEDSMTSLGNQLQSRMNDVEAKIKEVAQHAGAG